jgi:prepilin-type N-terminal cleavage/methylation domain-containing protein
VKQRLHRDAACVRGYTIVELMMAISIFAIGVTGVISMQRVTIMANQHARALAVAAHIAQAWQEELTTDAVQWNHPSSTVGASDIGETIWLGEIADHNDWFQPDYDDDRKFGPAFDALGNPVNSAAQAVFCTHIRLSWLYSETTPIKGNGLIRAEVRVFWLRDGEGHFGAEPFCGGTTDIAKVLGRSGDDGEAHRYHFVYKTSAIRQNTAQ